jgi:hypothetical protein
MTTRIKTSVTQTASLWSGKDNTQKIYEDVITRLKKSNYKATGRRIESLTTLKAQSCVNTDYSLWWKIGEILLCLFNDAVQPQK